MFNGGFSENQKVVAMNKFVRDLEVKHCPDVIIIGIPGLAMPYSYKYSSDFGIIAYEISEAVKSDFTILSSPCILYDSNFFSGVEKSLSGRLGVDVDTHSLSPYALDSNGFMLDNGLSYLTVDEVYIKKTIEQIGYDKLLNLNSMDGIKSAVDRIIEKFSNDSSSIIA
jgi:hypothetical protein